MADHAEIIEVAPRDGIQNEPVLLGLSGRRELMSRARAAGLRRIEAGSFVSARKVPQMADTDALITGMGSAERKEAIGLVLSRTGFERACAAGCGEINFVIVLSDRFSLRNQGRSTAECAALWQQMHRDLPPGMRSCVTFAAAFGCPYEGEVPAERLEAVLDMIGDALPDEFSLADTIGAAVPMQVRKRVRVLAARAPQIPVRLHLHNTRNTGYANAFAGLDEGVRILESSLGGVGGCPFAPRATGNIATEDLVYMLERSGIRTGVDLDRAIGAAHWLETRLNRPLPGQLARAGGFPPAEAGAA